MARKKPYVLMFAVLLLVGIIFTGVGVAGATGKFDFFALLKLGLGGGNPIFGTTTVGDSSTTLFSGVPRATQYTPSSSGTVTDIVLARANIHYIVHG